MTTMTLTEFIKEASRTRRACGEIGWLQTSAWRALDDGLSFDEWRAAVTAASNGLRPAIETLRKQFRFCEIDRNACLADDMRHDEMTNYGKVMHVAP